MNAILIPYFLAAYVAVNDTSEWTFGPEYAYDMNITYIMKPDPHQPIHKLQLISTIKCRPKTPDNLFCHLYNLTESELFENHNMTREAQTEQMFEIKFNEHGVEGLVIEPPSRMEVVNVLRKIATQFNVVVDRRKIGMSQFMARENSTMGDCAAVYRITREEPETDTSEKIDNDFRLVILPLADAKPETTLLIQKSRMGCINPPRYVDFSRGILEMRRFVSKIQINSDKFETFTEFDGKVRFSTESEIRILSFKEIIQINLNSIEPAQNQLPSLYYGELIDLNTNNDIPSNFIN
ncbi:PREDICTED: uncharacterized protein LOC105450101 isoform X1 [Wasmannia auropunctata]|uniref:uncharacterized protein LOC105450101 isoform X1 n=2 Tax=Wasmannia auropunctata TaxID=64793 RepID=UPI0005EF8357|nr:PREDICTED: uncharacterized protein LOC105450101 isoform X1 [Wasmannia auropunctata]